MILESWESSTVPLREKHPNENYDNLGRFNRIKNLKREEPTVLGPAVVMDVTGNR